MKYILGMLIVALLSLSIVLSACSTPQTSNQYDALAQCLTANGATMYGTEWCSHCKSQKETFSSSFQYIDYVDCDKYQNDCIAVGVEGYPTWKINGTLYPGTQNVYILARESGCTDSLLQPAQ